MICRARPKYIKNTYKEFTDNYQAGFYKNVEEKYYYNSASYGFYHFLLSYNTFYKTQAKVAIQTFTCVSMLNAIINSGSSVYLYDVSKFDCSIDFDLVDFDSEIDILVITHYQGIPNKNYVEFSEMCKKKQILLIDDLSQGSDSMISDIRLGTLSDVSIESYGWDKPYTSLYGGSIKVKKIATDFEVFYRNSYYSLEEENEKNAVSDIKLLYFLLMYTQPKNYYIDFDYVIFCNMRILKCFYASIIFRISLYRKFLFVIYKSFNRLGVFNVSSLDVKRMSKLKQAFIHMQVINNHNRTVQIPYIPYRYNNSCSLFLNTNQIVFWNRFSVIDDTLELKDYFKGQGVDVGNYNWPMCLHDFIDNNHNNCFYMTSFINSNYLKKHILNIPIWHLQQ